jgi:hypothetical protein
VEIYPPKRFPNQSKNLNFSTKKHTVLAKRPVPEPAVTRSVKNSRTNSNEKAKGGQGKKKVKTVQSIERNIRFD